MSPFENPDWRFLVKPQSGLLLLVNSSAGIDCGCDRSFSSVMFNAATSCVDEEGDGLAEF
jgi:hypothetical protein